MFQPRGLSTLPPHRQMLRAFLASDPTAEGIFYVAVKTTGVFCRPTCRARKPSAHNVEFFATASEAVHGGYRPCKRCRPMDVVRRPPELIERLRETVECNPTGRLTDKDLAAMDLEPSTARRQFKRYVGMTFHAYHRARRMGLALHDIRNGRGLIEIQLDRGYESGSAFREAFTKMFGVPPSRAKEHACLLARQVETPLGPMLALANDQGLQVLDFVDRPGWSAGSGRSRTPDLCGCAGQQSPPRLHRDAAASVFRRYAGRLRCAARPHRFPLGATRLAPTAHNSARQNPILFTL